MICCPWTLENFDYSSTCNTIVDIFLIKINIWCCLTYIIRLSTWTKIGRSLPFIVNISCSSTFITVAYFINCTIIVGQSSIVTIIVSWFWIRNTNTSCFSVCVIVSRFLNSFNIGHCSLFFGWNYYFALLFDLGQC